jgi:hypothetical protein
MQLIKRQCSESVQPRHGLHLLNQHKKLKAALGPLYLFYFATSSFSLMFFSFNIYVGYNGNDIGSIGIGICALGNDEIFESLNKRDLSIQEEI